MSEHPMKKDCVFCGETLVIYMMNKDIPVYVHKNVQHYFTCRSRKTSEDLPLEMIDG